MASNDLHQVPLLSSLSQIVFGVETPSPLAVSAAVGGCDGVGDEEVDGGLDGGLNSALQGGCSSDPPCWRWN